MVVRPQTSAAGVLALLHEPDSLLKELALKALNPIVPQFWAEISEHIVYLEALCESDELSPDGRSAAALLASKVYYFLGINDEALAFGLAAGPAFLAETETPGAEEYMETVISKAIDSYVSQRIGITKEQDPRLQDVIEGLFRRCIEMGEHKQAIGIALEAHRLDVVEYIFRLSDDVSLLSYTLEAVLEIDFSLQYRDEVLRFLLPLLPPLQPHTPYIHSVTRLLVTLRDSALTVPILVGLVPRESMLAYQIAFDLVEGGSQDFLEKIKNDLPDGDEKTKAVYDNLREILTGRESVRLYLEFLKRNNKTDMLILKNSKDVMEPRSSIYHNAVTFQNAFMHAGTTADTFLRENLDWLGKASNWGKYSATAALGVIHQGHFTEAKNILSPYLPSEGPDAPNFPGKQFSEGGALYALGLVSAGCGTEEDVAFLKNSLKNAGATNEVVAHGAAIGLGLAGLGGLNIDAYNELKQTLFTDSAVAGEAAGYSMGLIMLGSADADCADEMLAYARDTQHEKIIRGLAIGLALLYYGRQEQGEPMAARLLAEKDPILRYGGVYTLALAYAGTSNNNAVRRLLHIAVSDTSDDVRRAAVISLSFLLFKNPTQVPRIVQLLSESYNPHVRCGATIALGIGCGGTGLPDAIDILEPMTKDPVDFVRQGALIALGMVLVQQSDASCPAAPAMRALCQKSVGDKHEDPVARFGAALGAGLLDAGGRNVTISLLSRSGSRNTSAIVGMLLFCQFWYWYPLAHAVSLAFQPTAVIGLNSNLKPVKFDFVSNARPSLFAYPPAIKPPSKDAAPKVTTAVLSTTAKAKARERNRKEEKIVAESDEMEVTKTEVKKEETKDVEMKAVDGPSKPAAQADGDISPINVSAPSLPDIADKPRYDEKKNGEKKEDKKKDEEKTKKPAEPSFQILPNFSRITPAQLRYVSFPLDGRYQPIRLVSTHSSLPGTERVAGGGGILLLVDQAPEEPEEIIEPEVPTMPVVAAASTEPIAMAVDQIAPHIALSDGPEADPPVSFEYPFDDE